MQKKLIAVAVAGLVSGAAFAQSNVTIYGNMDIGYRGTSQDGTGADTTRGIDASNWSTSRIGFKGEEALGNGLKAVFVLEYGLANDNNAGIGTTGGAGSGTTRQQYVGLTGDFGTVIAGRLQPLAKSASDEFSAAGGANWNPSLTLAQGAGSTLHGSTRLNNAVAYVTPTYSGFRATAYYSFAGVTGTGTDDTVAYNSDQERIFGLGADYHNGPIAAAFVYHNARDIGGETVAAAQNPLTSALIQDQQDYFIAGSYDFGMVKILASYLSISREAFGSNVADLDHKIWSINADIPVSAAGTVYVGYANLNHDVTDKDASSWGIGYKHSLSKRTYLYTAYQAVSNDNLSGLGTYSGSRAKAVGEDANAFTFGMNHSF